MFNFWRYFQTAFQSAHTIYNPTNETRVPISGHPHLYLFLSVFDYDHLRVGVVVHHCGFIRISLVTNTIGHLFMNS